LPVRGQAEAYKGLEQLLVDLPQSLPQKGLHDHNDGQQVEAIFLQAGPFLRRLFFFADPLGGGGPPW
jgi:hypothetical protein